MHRVEREIKNKTEGQTSDVDILLSIGMDGQFHTSFYGKYDDLNFYCTNFAFLSCNIHLLQPLAFLSHSSYYMTRNASHKNVLFWLFNKLLEQNYIMERLKSLFRKFYARFRNLIEQYEVPSQKCEMLSWVE